MVLTGDGGDEMFAGYSSFFEVETLRRWGCAAAAGTFRADMDRGPIAVFGVRQELSAWASAAAPVSNATLNSFMFRIHSRVRYTSPIGVMPMDEAGIRKYFSHNLLPPGTDTLSQAQYFEATAKLTGDMLVKVDRMSMAASIEVRCPLLDHKLAEFAATLPPAWKMHNGQGKYCFLEAMRSRLPETVWNRRKQGLQRAALGLVPRTAQADVMGSPSRAKISWRAIWSARSSFATCLRNTIPNAATTRIGCGAC